MHVLIRSGGRFWRTLIFFILTLVLVDIWVIKALLPQLKSDFSNSYRLPEGQEMAWLPFYLSALAQNPSPALVFLGSSPTYGIRISDPTQTFPVATLRALQKKGLASNWQSYNLSAKGFLLSDQYYLLKKALPEGEAFVIQLNYHTFSPSLLKGTRMRHPELAEKLGVSVSEAEAALLGLRPSPPLPLNAWLRQGLSQMWAFYRSKELLAAHWLGHTPEGWAFAQYEKALGIQAAEMDGATPFLDLKPTQQMMVLKRYGQNAGFELSPDNSELQVLKWTVELLKQAGKPALFVMGPLNVEALDAYEALDWKKYQAVLTPIRTTIEAGGFDLLDINRGAYLPADQFFDITHTLNAGGSAFGERVAERLGPLLRAERRSLSKQGAPR
ncbi:MAG: hypothetical protein IV090_08480 [Candidatus Sericytochromatia bacterium]|nr:hypothetical protein [Candidatus Sericytochromatia bacterium]